MSNDTSEFQSGVDAIEREGDRKAAGRDRADDTASDFDAGWAAGRDDRNPDSPTSPKDSRQRVRDEYGPRTKKERAAYRDGYASGADPGVR